MDASTHCQSPLRVNDLSIPGEGGGAEYNKHVLQGFKIPSARGLGPIDFTLGPIAFKL